jgi:peptidoglycan/xylan/chitin deacetylase (PgdA/CDA1 family)
MRTTVMISLGVFALLSVCLAVSFIDIGHNPSPGFVANDAASKSASQTQAMAEHEAALAAAARVDGARTLQASPLPSLVPKLPHSAPCNNPAALGVERVVEIDATGGPGFGFQHFKAYDFLNPNEVVLTFDDGPWPGNTPAVLNALAGQCTKGTFFSIGKHAIWHPEILKQVAAQGHTIGSHTWSHADLTKKSEADAKDEIEKGVSAVRLALSGGTFAPFFRFPDLRHPQEMINYLGTRNIAMFSTDIDSLDFKIRRPEQVVQSVLTKLKAQGKGIILMHDFQRATAEGLPDLLSQLKANGYKVVQLIPKESVQTLPDYDALMSQEIKGATANSRPTASVVRTVSETN